MPAPSVADGLDPGVRAPGSGGLLAPAAAARRAAAAADRGKYHPGGSPSELADAEVEQVPGELLEHRLSFHRIDSCTLALSIQTIKMALFDMSGLGMNKLIS
jgi:hypothetical protein